MSPSRRIVALLVIAVLGLPGIAAAQAPATTATPGGSQTNAPPVQLGGGGSEGGSDAGGGSDTAGSKARTTLPNTGSDPRLLFLAGAVLMLLGVGLRLRTADADVY